VKVVNTVGSLLDFEGVAAEVPLGVLVVDSGGSVEWLMDISTVVNEESHGCGHSVLLSVFLVVMGHDLLVLVSLIVTAVFVEPGLKSVDHFGDVVGIELEFEV